LRFDNALFRARDALVAGCARRGRLAFEPAPPTILLPFRAEPAAPEKSRRPRLITVAGEEGSDEQRPSARPEGDSAGAHRAAGRAGRGARYGEMAILAAALHRAQRLSRRACEAAAGAALRGWAAGAGFYAAGAGGARTWRRRLALLDDPGRPRWRW